MYLSICVRLSCFAASASIAPSSCSANFRPRLMFSGEVGTKAMSSDTERCSCLNPLWQPQFMRLVRYFTPPFDVWMLTFFARKTSYSEFTSFVLGRGVFCLFGQHCCNLRGLADTERLVIGRFVCCSLFSIVDLLKRSILFRRVYGSYLLN